MGSLRTLFVRGLAERVSEDALKVKFEAVGPVLRCFTVAPKSGGAHLGYGFVEFEKAADCRAAKERLNGSAMEGKPIKIEFARNRAGKEERKRPKREGSSEEGKISANGESTSTKLAIPVVLKTPHVLVRSVAVGGFTAPLAEAVEELSRGAGEVEAVISPLPADICESANLARDGCKGESMLVVYKTVKMAMEAVSRLHGQACRSSRPKKKRKKSEDPAVAASVEECKLWCRQVSGEGAHLKKWRLIIRNLPFQVTEEAVREVLQAAGFVWQLDLPRKEDGSLKGFGFATFTCCAHAEKAISTINGKSIGGRQVSIDWAVGKSEYIQQVKHHAAEPKAVHMGAENGSKTEKGSQMANYNKHSQSADNAEADVKSETKMMRNVLQQFLVDEGEEGEAVQENNVRPSPGSDGQEGGGSPRVGVDMEAALSNGREERKARYQQKHTDNAKSCTVFVRGLPLDVKKHMVMAALERFGAIKSCRIVVHPDTGKSKGTAFVDFANADGAKQAVEEAESGRQGKSAGISILGCMLTVNLALSREGIQQLAKERGDAWRKKDKRNLYLAKEGEIEEGSQLWVELSPGDRTKRRQAGVQKKQKLGNPNFYVSTTRLCIRNLPGAMEEKELKEMCIKACKQRATKANPRIKQVKILTEEKGNGRLKSRCRGFVEFYQHDHALATLRQLNANPHVFGPQKRPIVEFAMENAKKVKQHEAMVAAARARCKLEKERREADSEGQDIREKPTRGKGKAAERAKPLVEREAPSRQAEGDSVKPGAKRKMAEGERRKAQQDRQKKIENKAQEKKEANSTGPAGPELSRKIPASGGKQKQQEQLAKGKKEVHKAAKKELKRKRKAEPEEKDSLDNLVSKYRTKYFASPKPEPGHVTENSFSKWFS
ncbi:unnamed protein product [Ostreobium quekettii]|uniref:RRM domain-containing protein n=1 Tax=Ostreobium quekettii TaxID=121088 RepID=A0A8S1JAB7_9CHLO|nr:unnamed protein product [Ostreobium quekettii]